MIPINLIILAAGKGTRLGKLTENIPKPLIHLGDGSTILQRQLLNAARSSLFEKVYIITGYNADAFDRYLPEMPLSNNVETIFNPQFGTYGPLISLWSARTKMLNGDFVIINGDTIYKKAVFDRLSALERNRIALLVSKKELIEKDDMKVKLGEDDRISELSKNNDQANLVSSGAASISGPENRALFVKLLNGIMAEDGLLARKGYWHEIFNILIGEEVLVDKEMIGLGEWKEIDTVEDLNSTGFNHVSLVKNPPDYCGR